MTGSYRGSGEASYHPRLLLGLIIYGYAIGVFSSRNLERASYDSVAFRFVAGNTHPDHDTIATFRGRFADEIKALFVQVLQIARANGLLKLGNVALDGTKVKANASRHSALSHAHALKLQEQLQAEVEQLLRLAEAADASDRPEGMDSPAGAGAPRAAPGAYCRGEGPDRGGRGARGMSRRRHSSKPSRPSANAVRTKGAALRGHRLRHRPLRWTPKPRSISPTPTRAS